MSPGAATGEPPRASRLALLLAAWALSAAPLALPASVAAPLGDASRSALAWIPWIALVGLPTSGRPARDWPLALGLALPVVALGAGVDRAAGLEDGRLLATSLGGAWAVGWLGEARRVAACRDSRLFGPLWLLLLGGLPALAAALAWGEGGRGPEPGLAESLAGLSPLAGAWGRVATGAAGSWGSVLLSPASLACLGLWGVAAAAGRRGARA